MAPVYDLAHSKYAPTVVAGFFATALLVLAVMVASTSTGVGGTLRPAATPAESRSVLDQDAAADDSLTRVLEGPLPFGVTFGERSASVPTAAPAPTGDVAAPPAPSAPAPTAPTGPVDQVTEPVNDTTQTAGDTVDETVDDAEEVVEQLTGLLDDASSGVTGLLP